MKVKDIVERVRTAIDELMANDSGFLAQSSDEKNLDDIIRSSIEYALQHIIENAPLEKLGTDMVSKLTDASSFSINTDMVGNVKLPNNMLRIVEARLSTWTQFPKPESDTSQVYLMQSDQYARGSWDRPVNILTYHGADRYLEMYTAKTRSDELYFAYIAKPELPDTKDDTDVSVPAQLEAALVYQIAGMAMVAFREENASSLFALADRYIGTEDKEKTA